MSILTINDKNFINCRSIIDYKTKITSIYKDKCFLFLRQIRLGQFSYNIKEFEHIKDFAFVEITSVIYENSRSNYFYRPKSITYASNPNITLRNIYEDFSIKIGLKSFFENSCYLELTKELVYELQ